MLRHLPFLTYAFLLVGSVPAFGDEAQSLMVSLPMYEVSDSLRKASDIFWNRLTRKLASKGVDAPNRLYRKGVPLAEHWSDDRLLLSQTCGYPYVNILMQKGVTIVATPVYSTNDDLAPGDYNSVIIVRAGTRYKDLTDLRGKTAAINDSHSNSGMNVFRATVAAKFDRHVLRNGVFEKVIVTGGHMLSIKQIASGDVDVAAIDCVTYDLICSNYPELAKKTRVLMKTVATPGLPLITSSKTNDKILAEIRSSLNELVGESDDKELAWALKTMRLKRFVLISGEEYRRRITELSDFATKRGYPQLK